MRPLLTIILLLCSLTCLSQKEANNWLFGERVGLQFGDLSAPPLVLRGELNTLEGCSSISDADGNLLFYSDGSTVWDKRNNIMPNGTGLKGDESSTQSAIIIPKPLDPDIYFLFTVGSTINPKGFNYYTIDLSLNGGYGEVVGTNVNLAGNLGAQWSEKITAVQGGECSTLWVTSLVRDTFYSFKVDENGVNPNPVISKVEFLADEGSRGYLKVSPNGTKIVAAHQGVEPTTNGCFLYSFDNITGQVFNDGISLFPNSREESPYGVEFSSQTNKLYISTFLPDFGTYKLYQFNLKTADIVRSKILIHTEGEAFRGSLQLGPDLKIYVTIPKEYTIGTNYLDVIHNPELDGRACNFEEDYIYLGRDSFAMQGLPPFVQSFFYIQTVNIVNPFEPVVLNSENLSLCSDSSYILEGPDIPDAEYFWTFNFGGFSGTLPLPNPPHRLPINTTGDNTLGTYELVVTSNSTYCDIQYIGKANVTFTTPPIFNPSVTLSSCDFFDSDSTDGLATFDLNSSIAEISNNPDIAVYFYEGDNEAELDIYNQNSLPQFYRSTSPNQIITAKIFENDSKCYGLGHVTLVATPSTVLSVSDLPNCDSGNGMAVFDLDEKANNIRGVNFLSNTVDILFFDSIENAAADLNQIDGMHESAGETLYFYATDNGSCLGSGTFDLVVNPLPPISSEQTNITVCEFSFPLTLNSGVPSSFEQSFLYEWSDGQTTNEILINDEQDISVKITDRLTGCDISRTYSVSKVTLPIITDVDVHIESGTVTVFSPENPNLTYNMDNPNGGFQSENVFLNVAPGIHNVYVSNECGISEEEIYVLGFPKFFTPNEDGSHDTWGVEGLDPNRYSVSDIKIFDRYGKLLKLVSPESNWDGVFEGKELPSSDYWFLLSVTDQDENTVSYSGHFSLIR